MKQLELQFIKPRDARQPGHFWQDNELIDVFMKRLGIEPEPLALYMYMTRQANNTTGEFRGSTRRIAKDMHQPKSSVNRWVNRLKEFGLIGVRHPSNPSLPVTYTIADVKQMMREQRESETRVPPAGHVPRNILEARVPPAGHACPTSGTANKDVKTKDVKTRTKEPPNPLFRGESHGTVADGEGLEEAHILQSSVRDLEPDGSLPTVNQQTKEVTRKLTPRQLERLRKAIQEIREASTGSGRTFQELLAGACSRTLIPYEAAKRAIEEADKGWVATQRPQDSYYQPTPAPDHRPRNKAERRRTENLEVNARVKDKMRRKLSETALSNG